MEYDRRIKLNVFQNPTTYSNDFRKFPNVRRELCKWPKETTEPSASPPCKPFKEQDHESFENYRDGAHVPFDLLWEPRPILQTNPRIPPTKHSKDEFLDIGKEEAIKTRPRRFISPAIPLDDVKEKDLKDLIIKSMYTTNLRSAQDEVAKYTRPIKRDIFDTSLDSLKDPLKFQPDKYPPLPDGWKDAGRAWDEKQKRAFVDPTKEFWLRRPLDVDRYAEIADLVPQEVKDEISKLIRDENLRQAHGQTKPLYTGYKPRLAVGVSLAKSDFPVVHPTLTLAQAIAKRQSNN